jgi:hypothetical protein
VDLVGRERGTNKTSVTVKHYAMKVPWHEVKSIVPDIVQVRFVLPCSLFVCVCLFAKSDDGEAVLDEAEVEVAMAAAEAGALSSEAKK